MQLAFSTNAFTNVSLHKAIRQVDELGYQGIEILADIPHAFPPYPSDAWISGIKQELERQQLTVSNINANTAVGFFSDPTGEPTFEPSLCNADKETRDRRIKYVKDCLKLARRIGSDNISITSGMCLPGNPPDKALTTFKASLEEILDEAERQNVNVGIEYEPGLLIENGEECAALIDEVGSTRLGVNLDLGHAEVVGEDIPNLIRRFQSKIWNIHLEDIKDKKHYHLIPGEGSMDFQEIFTVLKEINYSRFVTLELYTYSQNPTMAAEKSLAFLKPLLETSEDYAG